MAHSKRVLLTGSTGFVGRRLLPELQAAGYAVVAASRYPEKAKLGAFGVELRRMDVEEPDSIDAAMKGCESAVYLIHGMADRGDYAAIERRGAFSFRAAAERAGLSRIVYLGGLQPRGRPSKHLGSRLETGRILRGGRVPAIELQATMIVGGGSESWRMVRDLAARLPFMILPRWLDSLSEPIAIQDVTRALVYALSMPLESSGVFALPGPERLSAREILRRTARLLGSDPPMLRVPVITPRLSSYWIRLVTRADRHIAEELVEGLRSDLVASDEGFWKLMPDARRTPFDEAARRALDEEDRALRPSVRAAEQLLRSVPGSRRSRDRPKQAAQPASAPSAGAVAASASTRRTSPVDSSSK